MIRRGTAADLPAVVQIYDDIHRMEAMGLCTTGWLDGIYPTEQTARDALAAGELYVAEAEGRIAAAARINGEQMPAYAEADWSIPASDDQVLVLHTLVVAPDCAGRGCGTAFVRFYEQLARELGRPVLRMDTNARNLRARALYRRLGYREAGIIRCTFQGIPDVGLVCLESKA